MPQAAVPLAISFGLAAAQYAYNRFTAKPIGVGDRNFQVNISSTRKYVPVIYGRARVGIDVVFHDVNPSSSKDYWIVGSLCMGEIEAVDKVWFDDRLVVDYENNTGILSPYNGRVNIGKYTGTEVQTANNSLITIFPDKWTANHCGRGIAYIVVNINMDLDVFPNGVPKITVSLRGKKVRDPRNANYPDDTPAYSNNPALCILDYLAGGRDTNNNTRYGLGAPATEINLDYFRAEANFADELIHVPLGAPPASVPLLVNSTGNLGLGSYRYRCVYRSSSGKHTDAGGKSKKCKTTNNKRQIKLTEIQPSGSPEVAYVDVYRTVADGSVFKLAGTVANVLTEGDLEFNDNVADASLGAEAPADNNMDTANPTQKRFTCDGLVDGERDIKANLEDLMTSCRGNLVFESGLYALFTKKTTVPEVFELTEDTISGNWEFKAPGLTPMTNQIKVSFPNKSTRWETDYVFWPLDKRTNRYLAEDADFENPRTIDLFYTVEKQRARQIGQIVRKESRQGILASCAAFEEAMKLRYGCVVNVTHSTPAWTKKPFWVDSIGVYPNGQIQVSLSEYDATVYDEETIAVDTTGADDTDLPDPFAAPDEVTSVTITEELYSDKTVIGWRLKVTFTNPTSPLWDHSDVYVKSGSTANYEYYSRIDRSSNGIFYIYPVEALVTYSIKILSVSTLGVKNDPGDADNTVWTYTIIPALPAGIRGIELENKGNSTNAFGRDFQFKWPDVSAYGDGTADNSYAHAQTSFLQEGIRYVVEIRFSGIPDSVKLNRRKVNSIIARTVVQRENRYTYRYQDNVEDIKRIFEKYPNDANYNTYYGVAQRTITISVYALNAYSQRSNFTAVLEVTNQPPDMLNSQGDAIVPITLAIKNGVEVKFSHPYGEYDIDYFLCILAQSANPESVNATKRVSNYYYTPGMVIYPPNLNDFCYVCTQAGFSGNTAPEFTRPSQLIPNPIVSDGIHLKWQLLGNLRFQRVMSSISVYSSEDDIDMENYYVSFKGVDTETAYKVWVVPVDVYGRGYPSSPSQEFHAGVSHDDTVTRILPGDKPDANYILFELIGNNNGKISWPKDTANGADGAIVEWRAIQDVSATIQPGDVEVDQGYKTGDSAIKVIGGKEYVSVDKDTDSQDNWFVLRGMKAGFRYFARVRYVKTSGQLSAWSQDDDGVTSWVTHVTTIQGIGDEDFDYKYRRFTYTGSWTSSDTDTVSWGSGTLKFQKTSGGTENYSISSGNTGNMLAAGGWVVWPGDAPNANTKFKYVTAIDAGQTPIAFCKPDTNTAFFTGFADTKETMLTRSFISAAAIVAGNISVSSLSAISAKLGTLVMEHADGSYIKMKDSSGTVRLFISTVSGGTPVIRISKSGKDASTALAPEDVLFTTEDSSGNAIKSSQTIEEGVNSVSFSSGTQSANSVGTEEQTITIVNDTEARRVDAAAEFGGYIRVFPYLQPSSAAHWDMYEAIYDYASSPDKIIIKRTRINAGGSDWGYSAITIKVNWELRANIVQH